MPTGHVVLRALLRSVVLKPSKEADFVETASFNVSRGSKRPRRCCSQNMLRSVLFVSTHPGVCVRDMFWRTRSLCPRFADSPIVRRGVKEVEKRVKVLRRQDYSASEPGDAFTGRLSLMDFGDSTHRVLIL